jgi:hypothetical protein
MSLNHFIRRFTTSVAGFLYPGRLPAGTRSIRAERGLITNVDVSPSVDARMFYLRV